MSSFPTELYHDSMVNIILPEGKDEAPGVSCTTAFQAAAAGEPPSAVESDDDQGGGATTAMEGVLQTDNSVVIAPAANEAPKTGLDKKSDALSAILELLKQVPDTYPGLVILQPTKDTLLPRFKTDTDGNVVSQKYDGIVFITVLVPEQFFWGIPLEMKEAVKPDDLGKMVMVQQVLNDISKQIAQHQKLITALESKRAELNRASFPSVTQNRALRLRNEVNKSRQQGQQATPVSVDDIARLAAAATVAISERMNSSDNGIGGSWGNNTRGRNFSNDQRQWDRTSSRTGRPPKR